MNNSNQLVKSKHDDSGNDSCHEFLELLPWFVNDSLPVPDQEKVRRHLARCECCAAEHTFLLSFQQQLRAGNPPRVSAQAWDSLRSRLPVRQRRHAFAGLLRRAVLSKSLMLHKAMPPLRHLALPLAACSILFAVVTTQVPWSRNDTSATASYKLMTSQQPVVETNGKIQLRVLLKSGNDQQVAAQLFSQINVDVVAGPSARGVYTVAPQHDVVDREKFINDLRRNSLVDFVEWVE